MGTELHFVAPINDQSAGERLITLQLAAYRIYRTRLVSMAVKPIQTINLNFSGLIALIQ